MNLQFDFLVDKKKNTITIKREFAADRHLFGIATPKVNFWINGLPLSHLPLRPSLWTSA